MIKLVSEKKNITQKMAPGYKKILSVITDLAADLACRARIVQGLRSYITGGIVQGLRSYITGELCKDYAVI